MDQQTLRSTSTSRTGFDCSAGIKEEPEDDCAEETVENQSTDECDMKQQDRPFINITPIVTNQSDICKTEDGPKVKLERHSMGCPLYEPSEMSTIKCEFYSTMDCSNITKEQCSPTSTIAQTDDGDVHQLIEVSGEIDCKADVSDVADQISVGPNGQVTKADDVKQKERLSETKADDVECDDGNKLEGMYRE